VFEFGLVSGRDVAFVGLKIRFYVRNVFDKTQSAGFLLRLANSGINPLQINKFENHFFPIRIPFNTDSPTNGINSRIKPHPPFTSSNID